MKAEKISDHVYVDTSGEGRGNIGAIELPSYTLVVDSTMFPTTARGFRTSLESQTKSPIRKLVLTHCHADHVLGNQIFRDCEIVSSNTLKKRMKQLASTEWTPQKLAEYEEKFPEFTGKLRDVTITLPTKTFEKTMRIEDGDVSATVTHSGGHSEDTSYLYFPKEKTLFSGDLIFAKSFPWGADKTCDPEKWMQGLKRFKEMDIDAIVPGHGPICGREEVENYLHFFEATTAVIKDLIKKDFDEREVASYKGFPEFYPPRRLETRTMSLVNWYNFYKQRTIE